LVNFSYWGNITTQVASIAYQITGTILAPILYPTSSPSYRNGWNAGRGTQIADFLFTITTILDQSIIFRQRTSGQICAASNEACVKMRGCLVSWGCSWNTTRDRPKSTTGMPASIRNSPYVVPWGACACIGRRIQG
jgi:hypothetical protein